MNPTLEAIQVPLKDDGHGGLRVGQTRVGFETLWHTYQQGACVAEIVHAFDTLNPADVHAVLAWALRHPVDVDAYLKRREEEAVAIRRKLEESGITPSQEKIARLKAKLMARSKDLQRQSDT